MKALPKDFLEEIANYCELTGKQAEGFIAFYSSNKTKESVAADLKISPSALYQRLVRVYENIGNSEDNNKLARLHSLLWEKYQHQDDICIYYLYKIRKIREVKKKKNKCLNLSNDNN